MTNDDMAKIVDTNDAWIRRKTGIEKRYFAEKMENSDMAMAAARQAIKTSGLPAESIDLIVVCTFTHDLETPSMACRIAGRIGAPENVLTFDINGACSGFIHGMTTVNALLESGRCKRALIVGSEKLSQMIDYGNRNTCVLFGDGAGALVVEYEEDGLFISNAGCHPDDDILGCRKDGEGIFMSGQEVYRFAVSRIPMSMQETLDSAGMTADDVDWFVCHQANMRIIESVARKMGVPMERFFTNIQYTGNTAAASVAICLGEMMERGLFKKDMTFLASGFGAGLTWGSILMKV